MSKQAVILVGCLLLNILSETTVNGSILEKIARGEDGSPKLNDSPYGIAHNIQTEKDSTAGQREKRFYNYFDYNFDYNLNPEFPTLNRRTDDPLELILRRLQDITDSFKPRTYLPPPTIPQPTFFPLFYIPKVMCPCSNDRPPTPSKEPLPTNVTSQSNPNGNAAANNSQDPNNFPNRFPVIEDSREIWSTSETNADYESGDDTDGSRPISLKPVQPKRPSSRPSPPVDHGSEQAGLQPPPEQPIADVPPPKEVSGNNPEVPDNKVGLTSCETAAVTCCHKPQVTYECFTSNSCMNPTELGSPCDPEVILKIINKLQYYYGSKNTPNGSNEKK